MNIDFKEIAEKAKDESITDDCVLAVDKIVEVALRLYHEELTKQLNGFEYERD